MIRETCQSTSVMETARQAFFSALETGGRKSITEEFDKKIHSLRELKRIATKTFDSEKTNVASSSRNVPDGKIVINTPDRARKNSVGSQIPRWTNSNDSLNAKVSTDRKGSAKSPIPVRKSNVEPQNKTLREEPSSEDNKYNAAIENGKMVIFSHENFQSEERRLGAQKDVDNLITSMARFGIRPTVYKDLKYDQIKTQLGIMSKETKSCLMVFVLTHGDKDLKEKIHAQDKSYSPEKIWKPFMGNNCPTYLGKPKVFFFVACRGTKADSGATLVQPRQRRPSTATDASVAAKGLSYTIPTHADILIVHSTQPDHYSFRDTERGTWFIEALHNEINKLKVNEKVNIFDLLTDVTRRVAYSYQSYNEKVELHNKKQCSSFTSTFTKRLILEVKK